MKKYPDLVGAYGIIAAARVFAADKLPESTRDEFVEMARRHVVEKVMAGGKIQGPKIYLTPARTNELGDQAKPGVEMLDKGKLARMAVGEKER